MIVPKVCGGAWQKRNPPLAGLSQRGTDAQRKTLAGVGKKGGFIRKFDLPFLAKKGKKNLPNDIK